MMTFCTLFNVNYIDKALTMYESIERHTESFMLYVLAMDNRCYEILYDLNLDKLKPIRLSDFETNELLEAKSNRSIAEYCWTCSASIVDYVMRKYNPDYCTYIDSDLYFYDDPHCIIEEMERRGASVQITGHRFCSYMKQAVIAVGKYCVEFNTFKNDARGRELLDIWRRQCLEYCRCDGDGIHWADQKYMDNWTQDYAYAIETNNLGAGIAPWNISQYKLCKDGEKGPSLVKCKGKKIRPLFYHFQNIRYEDNHTVNTNTAGYCGIDKNLVKSFYLPYLLHIQKNKKMLEEKYGISVVLKKHPGIKDEKKDSGKKRDMKEILISRLKKIGKIEEWKRFFIYRFLIPIANYKGIIDTNTGNLI